MSHGAQELFRFLFDLVSLALDLRLVHFSFALGCQERAGAHREGTGQHAREAADKHQVAASGVACHATYDAKDSSQAVIGPINSIAQPSAAALVPALAA